jgi:hypothetical protein
MDGDNLSHMTAQAILIVVLLAVASHIHIAQEFAADEAAVIGFVDGQRAYNRDLQLEKLTLDREISGYSFRSAGSKGATATADWLVSAFTESGLETYTEDFSFTTWELTNAPLLLLDIDNNPNTTDDQIVLQSFMAKHLAWPTGSNGVFGRIVVLPLPEDASAFQESFWDNIHTKDRIVLVGREFGLSDSLRHHYVAKIKSEAPLAIVQTWWSSNLSAIPAYTGSQEGRIFPPGGEEEVRYWDLKIPVGMVNYYDGLRIRKLVDNGSVSARLVIDARIGKGPHKNVIGVLTGLDSSRMVVVSGHYDSVTTAGFGDNGAGTAGVLELAHAFATAKQQGVYIPPCNLMFVSFAAEELWLVGSSFFVKQHKGELTRIEGVINLDPIGSDQLAVSESPSNLDEIVLSAARQLRAPILVVPREEASSDNWSFELPGEREEAMQWAWNTRLGIADAVPRPAVWLGSLPLQWSSVLSGKPGWIHTPYDNSSSTQAYGWMRPENMEAHLKVAALAVTMLADRAQRIVTEQTLTSESTAQITLGAVQYTLAAIIATAIVALTVYSFSRKTRNQKSTSAN